VADLRDAACDPVLVSVSGSVLGLVSVLESESVLGGRGAFSPASWYRQGT